MHDIRPPTSASTQPRGNRTSLAFSHVQVYHPGILLVAGLMLSPALLALALAGASLLLVHSVPYYVPFLLLLLLPAVPAAWLTMATTRTSPTGIAATRLLRAGPEIPWTLIEHAGRGHLRVTVESSDGQRLVFVPLLLHNGAQLYRELLVRLPTQVLDARMRADAHGLLAEQVLPTSTGGLTGSLRTRPRRLWRAAALLCAACAALGGAAGALLVPPPAGPILAAMGVAALGVALLAYRWFAQTLTISSEGIQVTYPFRRQPDHMPWDAIQLIEHTPAERVLRLRGNRRLVCAGPTLLRAQDQALMRAFLHAYSLSRGVPVARRRWLV